MQKANQHHPVLTRCLVGTGIVVFMMALVVIFLGAFGRLPQPLVHQFNTIALTVATACWSTAVLVRIGWNPSWPAGLEDWVGFCVLGSLVLLAIYITGQGWADFFSNALGIVGFCLAVFAYRSKR